MPLNWGQAGCYTKVMIDSAVLANTKRGLSTMEEAEKVIYNVNSLLNELKCCSMRRDLKWGRRIHVKAVEYQHDSNIYVVTGLIRMYSKCSSIVDARRVFDSIKNPDVVSWNVLLLGYAENGDGLTALDLFSKMKACGYAPDSVTYVAALKACTSLAEKRDWNGQGECLTWGKEIHSEIGCNCGIFVQSALIDMYGKCGSMSNARSVFENMQKPNVVCWNALLMGYVENGEGLTSLELFSRMKACGCAPDSVTYMAALKACGSLAGKRDTTGQGWLKRGREIHSEIGCDLGSFAQNTLIDMYCKCGSMFEAHRVFESIRKPDVVSWNVLLQGYAENGDELATLKLFSEMKARGCAPNSATYIAALKACTYLAQKQDGGGPAVWLKQGREIHAEIGCNLSLFVKGTLIDMYGKCGSMVDARSVFESMEKPNVVCWNALLIGYVDNGEGLATLELFSRMKACGCVPDSVTLIAALKACGSLAWKRHGSGHGEWLKRGKEIHSEISCTSGIFLQSALIDMYGKCGCMLDARRVFDSIEKPNAVCWSALLMGYVDNGQALATLELFSRMKACGLTPDSVTYIAAFKACTALAENRDKDKWLKRGKEIHSEIGCDLGIFAQSTLIDMYCKCGNMMDARNVFESIQKPDVVSWTALLLGYAENGDGFSTLELFSKMKASGCVPNSLTYVAVLKACGLTGALALGRKFHLEIREFTAHVVTCLVDFYANCGSIVEAREVFDTHLTERDVSTWTALLTGYGSFGDTASVFNLFEAMQDQGFQPDAVTFVCMLSCCSHAGFIEKAKEYFARMPMQYGVTPTVMHYNCMVDIMGRMNQLDEAFDVLQKMPCSPDAVTWMTLLAACRKWKNVKIGRCAFQSLVNMDRKNALAYVLMAHIYGSRGMWEDQEKVLEAKIKLGSCKSTGQAYVYDEVGNMVKFSVGEEDPPDVKNKLQQLLEDMGPYSSSRNVADCEKEDVLCGHCERRAVVYGILRTPADEPVRAFKNMSMCDNCHFTTKMISKLCERVIMVRDSSRFHVMMNGTCSCGDYW